MGLCTIVGVGPKLGFALAKKFASEGYDLGLIARDKPRLDQYAREISSNHRVNVQTTSVDIKDPKFSELISKYSHSDVLIYNAARVAKSDLLSVSPEQVAEDLHVGVIGAIFSIQEVLPFMQTQQKGTILLTSGGFAFEPNPEYATLGLAKACIENLALSYAPKLACQGIHLSSVTIWGKIQEGSTQYDPKDIARKYFEIHSQSKNEWQHRTDIR